MNFLTTLNMALGNNSVTLPLNSKVSCLAKYYSSKLTLNFFSFNKYITDEINLAITLLSITNPCV